MTLLDNLPDECSIYRRVRTRDELVGTKDTSTLVSSTVNCWEQSVSQQEVDDYRKQGMSLRVKVYFTDDPGLTRRHQIAVTKRNGSVVSSPDKLDVLTDAHPDKSVGSGILYCVMCGKNSGEDD